MIQNGFFNEVYAEFPNIINLEVYRGACPCNCVHCPVGLCVPEKRKNTFGADEISLSTLTKIVDEVKKYPHCTLRLHSVGEPVLWKNLIPAIKITHENNVRTWIFTSLVTQDKKLLNALCEFVDIIEVSVNSIDRENYLASKGIDAFELVSENIKYISKYIADNDLKTRLIVSRVQSNSKELDDEFVSYWNKTGYVDDAFVRSYHNYNDIIDDGILKAHAKEPCLVHWMRFNISCTGVVVACFNELFHRNIREDIILGSVLTNSIKEIWHNEIIESIRDAEINGYTDAFPEDFPCRNCKSCQPYDGIRVTSERQVNLLNTCKG